jgi:hypothetical protein
VFRFETKFSAIATVIKADADECRERQESAQRRRRRENIAEFGRAARFWSFLISGRFVSGTDINYPVLKSSTTSCSRVFPFHTLASGV